MTVKELIRELQNVPEDAIVTNAWAHYFTYIVEGVDYNDTNNTISFYGGEVFDESEEDEESDIHDDVDESNYYPRGDCKIYGPVEMW